ncbi:acid-sensing ion channel 1C-like [Glandiceps talaboti]
MSEKWAQKTGKVNPTDLSDETDFGNTKKGNLVLPDPELKIHRDTQNELFGRKSNCAGVFMTGFIDDCGISGVKFVIGASVVPLRRTLWLLVLLAGVGIMSYQVWERITYFASAPMNVNVEINYVQNLTFPAIAICNFNMYRKSVTDFYNVTDLITSMYGTFDPDFTGIDFTGTDNDAFYITSAHQLHEMILGPTWQRGALSLDAFQTIMTDFGACYAFNTGNDSYGVRTVDNTGTSYGLSMYLDSQEHDYNVGARNGAGFQIVLYEQGDVPLVTDLGFALAAGQEIRVGVEVTSITNLPPPHGICHSKELQYYSKYSKNACRLECLTDYVVNICGCRSYFMPGPARMCDPSEIYYCVENASHQFVENSTSCDCPIPCNRVIYKANLSHAKFPSTVYSNFLSGAFGMSASYFESNIGKVDIFFQELSIHEIKQQKAYDVFGLLCDIGGSLGLWLGGSILTVIEILDIVFKGCCNKMWH